MAKKNKKNNPPESKPMPSLIFHEGKLEEQNSEPTPNADQIEKELLKPARPPTLTHLQGYNPSAHRILWLGVISVALIICGMWGYSIYSQLSLIRWKKTSEQSFLEDTKKNWQKAFYDDSGRSKDADQKLKEIKENLTKLFAGTASGTSTTSSTQAVSTTP